ncbi:unnamed protein product [Caenorhabditis nigoni]
MTTKEYHIGKTVPEMIARLEKRDKTLEWNRFVRIWDAVIEIDKEFDEMDQDRKIENYKIISEYAQQLVNPTTPVPNYDTMPHEELIKDYNRVKYLDEIVELLYGTEPATSAKNTVKFDWTPFQNMGNRVKTAVIGIFESMKKRIGKKNNF